jgi:hypothetical protein
MAVRAEQKLVVDEPNCPYAKKYITKALGYFAAKAAKAVVTPDWYRELAEKQFRALAQLTTQATTLFNPWLPYTPKPKALQDEPSTEIAIPEPVVPEGPETEVERQDRLHTNMYRLSRACIRCSGQATTNPPLGPIDCPLILAVSEAAENGGNYFLDSKQTQTS